MFAPILALSQAFVFAYDDGYYERSVITCGWPLTCNKSFATVPLICARKQHRNPHENLP